MKYSWEQTFRLTSYWNLWNWNIVNLIEPKNKYKFVWKNLFYYWLNNTWHSHMLVSHSLKHEVKGVSVRNPSNEELNRGWREVTIQTLALRLFEDYLTESSFLLGMAIPKEVTGFLKLLNVMISLPDVSWRLDKVGSPRRRSFISIRSTPGSTCSSSGGGDWMEGVFTEECKRKSKASVAGLILNSSMETLSSIRGEQRLESIGKSASK